MGLNVRVIRLSKALVRNGKLSSNKSVMLTEGYSGNIDDCQKRIVIQFCPFCGTNLKYIKKNDLYIQEDMELV